MPPTYVITAAVPSGNRFKEFSARDEGSVSSILERPPTFRWAGFDTSTEDQARRIAPDAYEVSNGDRKVLRVYQDGTLIFRMTADPDFLCWSQEEDEYLHAPRLDPVPVVEVHASFVHLYAALIPKLLKPPQLVRFTMNLRDAEVNGARLSFTRYYQGGIRRVIHPKLYHAYAANLKDSFDSEPELIARTPNLIAYQLLVKFYAFFEMAPDLIPFVKDENGKKAIDIEAIRRL